MQYQPLAKQELVVAANLLLLLNPQVDCTCEVLLEEQFGGGAEQFFLLMQGFSYKTVPQ